MHPYIARSVIRCFERDKGQRSKAFSTWLTWLSWRR